MDRYRTKDARRVRSPTARSAARAAARALANRRPELANALERLFHPVAEGGDEGLLRWTCRSVGELVECLHAQGRRANTSSVGALLHELGYALHANRKNREGSQQLDKDAQFRHVDQRARAFLGAGEPVVWVNTRKQLIGRYRIGGLDWRFDHLPPPEKIGAFVQTDFGEREPASVAAEAIAQAIAEADGNWVDVGIDEVTTELAVNAVRRWWRDMGRATYPTAERLLVVADDGGSESDLSRLWKMELQRIADATGLQLSMCHLPPVTFKWRRIEHRLCSRIVEEPRDRPRVSREAMVNVIGDVSPEGLRSGRFQPVVRPVRTVATDQIEELAMVRDAFQGQWNYELSPRTPRTPTSLMPGDD